MGTSPTLPWSGLALVLFVTLSVPAVGYDEGTPEQESSVLLVLRVAGDTRGQDREQHFISELRMILDGVPIVPLRPENPEFSCLSLGEQIARVRPLIEWHDAVAATWLDEIASDHLLLHMVAVSSGRALARLVEIEAKPGFETDLALAARELLGTAFLFHDLPDREEGPIGRVVESVRREAAPVVESARKDVVPLAEPEERARWSVVAGASIEGGLRGHAGPSLLAGGLFSLDGRMAGGMHGRISFSGRAGPLNAGEDPKVETWTLDLGPGVLYLWDFGVIQTGPGLELRASWFRLRAEVDRGAQQEFTNWAFRVSAIVEVRVRVIEGLGLVVAGGVGGTPEREAFYLSSTDRTVLRTPWVSWEARLGVVFNMQALGR